ncbi:MAG: iron-sulfur cluster-binding protein [Pirellula sp.]|nr:iron-sulfur cluster-binding protein [Pirellula sp.]
MSDVPSKSPGNNPGPPSNTDSQQPVNRRSLLIAGGVVAAGAAGYTGYPFMRHVAGGRSPVFIAGNQKYDGPLAKTIEDGLLAVGIKPHVFKDKRVLLKPNLVEPMRGSPQMTTHPAMVVACAEVFRNAGAFVSVGEAPGHMRDTEAALVEGRLGDALLDAKLPFADLNYEESQFLRNAGRISKLPGFYFPRSILEADLVVSMPKLKTHHWVGLTVSMKNLYGTLPGNRYGWPKNVLHHAGIPQTVVDINATLPPTIAVVDGIQCMEGDGPILGTAKEMGLVVIGADKLAVDSTCARIIGMEPSQVSYLQIAYEAGLGQMHDFLIRQVGERWQPLVSPFRILDRPHLRSLQTKEAGRLTS